MNATVKRELVRNTNGQIEFWLPKGESREHYHIRVWIECDDSVKTRIVSVDYLLHPSFRRRIRSSSNQDSSFAIDLWTWGMFKIEVTLHTNQGPVMKIPFYLSYELPDDDGTNYVQVEPS